MKIKVEELPINLLTLGDGTFYLSGENVKITKIPPLIKILPFRCFFICPNVNVTEFGIEENHTSSFDYKLSALETIGIECFYASGNSVTTIHIHEGIGVKNIQDRAFRQYGNNYFGMGGYEKYTPLKSFIIYAYETLDNYVDIIAEYLGISDNPSEEEEERFSEIHKELIPVTKES